MKNSTYPRKSSNNAKKSRYLPNVSPRGLPWAEVVPTDALEREIEPVGDLPVEPAGTVNGLLAIDPATGRDIPVRRIRSTFVQATTYADSSRSLDSGESLDQGLAVRPSVRRSFAAYARS